MSENNIFKQLLTNFFSKIIAPIVVIVVKFHMKHDLTPGFQNCKIWSGEESKMATVTNNNKTTKSTCSPEP